MTTYKYKSTDGSDFTIPGVGQSQNGVITSDHELESPNLEFVDSYDNEPTEPVAPQSPVNSTAAPVAQPGAILGVAPQATQPTNNTENK